MAIVTCGPGCTTEHKNAGGGCADRVVTYAGAVLDKWEENGCDDSDFIAAVWNGEKVTTVCYASTRSWTYHNGATVDATAQVRAAAIGWLSNALTEVMYADAVAAARRPEKGLVVRSNTTRGKNVGVTGTVMWMGESSRYGYQVRHSITRTRVGLKVDGHDKLVYMDADRVEVVEPAAVDKAAVAAEAARRAGHEPYHSVLRAGFRSAVLTSY